MTKPDELANKIQKEQDDLTGTLIVLALLIVAIFVFRVWKPTILGVEFVFIPFVFSLFGIFLRLKKILSLQSELLNLIRGLTK